MRHADEAIAALVALLRSDRTPPTVRRAAARDLLRLGLGRQVSLPEVVSLLADVGWRADASGTPVDPENRMPQAPRPIYGVAGVADGGGPRSGVAREVAAFFGRSR